VDLNRTTYLTDFLLVTFAIFLGAALLAHAYVGFFTRYMADDYCVAGTIRSSGLLLTQKSFYLGWSGRYSFTFVAGVFSLIGPRIVPLLPALALLMMLAALTWAIFPLLSGRSRRQPFLSSLVLAELIVFVTVTDNPGGVYEALYWQTGMLTYWLPLILMIVWLGLIIRVDRQKERRAGALQLVSCVALTFIAGGFNETYAVVQICAILIAIVWCGWRRLINLIRLLGAGLIGAIIALAVLALAPGNHVREAQYPPHPNWLIVIESSVRSAFKFLFVEPNYPATSLYRVLLLVIPALMAIFLKAPDLDPAASPLSTTIKNRTQLDTVILLPLSGFLVLVACFAPAMWAMSKQPPPRALLVPEFVMVCLMVAWSYSVGQLIKRFQANLGNRRLPLLTAVLAVLAAVLTIFPLVAARNTLARVGRVKALAAIWDRQDQEIRAAATRRETDLTVPVMHNIGGTDLMTPDPKWYVNQCVAAFYGVKTITAKPSLEGQRIMTEVPDQ
jgi:hypothetical protein